MPATFKNPFRGFLHAIMPMSVLESFGTPKPGYKVIPQSTNQIPVEIWGQLVDLRLKPWDNESKLTWIELTTNRVHKIWLYKESRVSEHEFIVVEVMNKDGRVVYLRFDRAAGERVHSSPDSSPWASSMFSTDPEDSSESFPNSPTFYKKISSRSSSSINSIAKSLSKVPVMLQETTRRLSDSSVSRLSTVSSGKHYAADMMTRIDNLPSSSEAKQVKSISYSCKPEALASLWDLMILANVVHEYSKTYQLLERQCFWYADTICAILETWPRDYRHVKVEQLAHKKWYTANSNLPYSGRAKSIVVYRRKDEVVAQVLTAFKARKEEFEKARLMYERERLESEHQLKELTKQVAEKDRQMVEKDRQREEEKQAMKKQLEEETRRQEEEKQAMKKQLEEETRRQEEEKRAMKKQLEEETRRREEETRRREEETRRREEETRRREEEKREMKKQLEEQDRRIQQLVNALSISHTRTNLLAQNPP